MATVKVEIPDVYGAGEARFRALVEGMTPLLMHKPSMKAASDEVKKSGDKIPLPEDEAAAAAYRNEKGELIIPAVAFQRAMVEAGKHFQDPSYKKATLTRPISAALYPAEVEGFPIFNGNGEVLSEYQVDVRRAVITTAVRKPAVMRARPRIDLPWSCVVEMPYDQGTIPKPELLAQVLALAGAKVGVLDFRPQKGGPYGRFKLVEFEVQSPGSG